MAFWNNIFKRKEKVVELQSTREVVSADTETISKRSFSAFQAAQYNRLTGDWLTTTSSADSELTSSITVLRNRSRDLVRNNSYARGACRLLVDSVIGKGMPLEGDEVIEELWEEWSENPNYIHTEGKLSLCQIQRLVFRSVFESGECFVRLFTTNEFGSPVPLALQVIEADQLADHTHQPGLSSPSNNYRMGIEFNSFMRPVYYYFRSQHPGDVQFPSVAAQQTIIKVPASEIIHVYVTERPNQSRGIPWLSSVALKLRDLEEFERYQLLKAKAEASVTGFVTSPDLDISEGDDSAIPNYELAPGRINKLSPGEDMQFYEAKVPGANIADYTASVMRSIAAGLGVSYESLSRDFTNTSYSSARTSRLDEIESYRITQDWFINIFLKPLYCKWLELAQLSGLLPSMEMDLYKEVTFCPRGYGWVDPKAESIAYELQIKNGFTTRSHVLTEQGYDFEETMEQLAYEKEYMEGLGLELGEPKEVAEPDPVEKPAQEDNTKAETEDRSFKQPKKGKARKRPRWGRK